MLIVPATSSLPFFLESNYDAPCYREELSFEPTSISRFVSNTSPKI
jgi:hypothetical protein